MSFTTVKSSNTVDMKATVDEEGRLIPHHISEMSVNGECVCAANPLPVELVPSSNASAATSQTDDLLAEIRDLIAEQGMPDAISEEISQRQDSLVSKIGGAVGPDGALRRPDAPALISGRSSTLNGVIIDIDTTGFMSIAVQLFGTWAGTVAFVASNDRVTWYAVSGWAATAAQLPVTTTAASGLWIFPAIGRYFRAYHSAYTSGTVVASAYLRNQPLPFPSVPSINNAQIAGTAVVTAGVAGIQAIGGNIAVGTAPTANPVLAGGIDTGGRTRRVRTSTDGDIINAGLDRNAVARSMRVASDGSLSTVDGSGALEEILLELRKQTVLLSMLPETMNSGVSLDIEDAFMKSTLAN